MQTHRAYTFQCEVTATHTIALSLPADAPTGPAQVIVLFPDESATAPAPRTKEEIDRYVADERASWD